MPHKNIRKNLQKPIDNTPKRWYYGVNKIKEDKIMAYKCLDCGNIFEEGEQGHWEETHGERMSGCPVCRGPYEEAVRCDICGGEYLEDELHGWHNKYCCDGCIDEHRKDFDLCYRLADRDAQTVEMNCLLRSLLPDDEIETILYLYIKEKKPHIDCSAFIDDDKSDFAEKLVEEVSKK